jgi:dihydrofolate reductase
VETIVRKIIAGLFISLDGVVEAPDQWHFPYFNDEMGVAVTATLGAADTVLFGRKTYDSFAGAWPEREAAGGEDAGMAKALGDARKIVVSNQQLELAWRNSEQLQGDLVETVAALRNEPDGDIALSGSVSGRPPAAGRGPAESTGDATYEDAKLHLPPQPEH